MQTEIEVKFLGIDHDAVRTRLKKIGAKCAHPMRQLQRVNMDFPDNRLEERGGWVRIRTNGPKTALAYKQLEDWTLHGVKEVEVEVSDFADTQKLLEGIGLVVRSYQETKRETWRHKGAEIVLDEWPWVRSFMEIEGISEENVRQVASELGLDWKDAVFGSVEPVYIAEFDITEKEFYTLDHMTFKSPIPDWLKARTRAL
ncbi:MAG TPA: class IV adenylate cyclase [Verrucomicrobiae bacterium]|nr:class IV adenylate cyclase [Verrucomicrobiae bacterium]